MLAQVDVDKAAEIGEKVSMELSPVLDAVSSDIGRVMTFSVVVLIVLGSAAMASSVAESRLRGRDFHFILGFLIPVVYPALIFCVLPKRKYSRKQEEERKEEHQREGPPPVEGPKLAAVDAEEDEDSPLDEMGASRKYNQAYFKNLLFDDSGNSRGPFLLLVDGVELRAERILDVMPQMVVLETINADGKQQTIRIPYQRIGSCREL